MSLTKRGEWFVIGLLIFLAVDAVYFHLKVTNGQENSMGGFMPIPMAPYGTTYKGR